MANVLLVDDDGSVLLTLAIALRRYGHTVTVACDGNQALLHLKRHQFAYLVSDIRMPGMSGIELASRARRLAHPPRVILTSAYSNVQ
ncbi:MAG: response regulator, partial [Abitibacteriaceae bacterium]|nr:response regulator [Abditibacteriaceae bacterium]